MGGPSGVTAIKSRQWQERCRVGEGGGKGERGHLEALQQCMGVLGNSWSDCATVCSTVVEGGMSVWH